MTKHLSYANVVASMALFLVLGGSAVAASAIIKKPSQLRNGVVTNKKVKKGTLAADRLSKKARAALKGASGPQGAPGPAGSIQAAPAGGDLTGSFPNPLIKPLAVLNGHIADNAVTAAKIQNNAVGESELAGNSVGASELKDDSVGSSELQPLSVLAQNIATNAVTSAKIAEGTITGSDLANGAVGNGELAGDAVTADKVAPEAIGSSEIVDGDVKRADLGKWAVDTEHIETGAVNSLKLADGSVSRRTLLASGIHNPGNLVEIPADGCIEQTIDPPGTVQWTHALITARDIAYGGEQAAPGTIVQGIHRSSGDNIRLQLCSFNNSPVYAPVVDWAVL